MGGDQVRFGYLAFDEGFDEEFGGRERDLPNMLPILHAALSYQQSLVGLQGLETKYELSSIPQYLRLIELLHFRDDESASVQS